MKIVIVMAYHNRQMQLDRTLETIAKSRCTDVEIVLVDDGSSEPLKRLHNKYPIRVIRIEPEEKTWLCPVIPFNKGIKKALDIGADVVVLQNPENFHVEDCLAMVEDKITDKNYLSFSCFSLNAAHTALPGITEHFPGLEANYPIPVGSMGVMGWYNHPDCRPCYLHFFSAITRDNMIKLNGFDERFADGVAYDDNDLVRRVRNLGLELIIPVGAFVVHQWHYSGPSVYMDNDAVNRNFQLVEELHRTDKSFRAVHTLTPDFAKD